jgi:hypothetical protein
MGDRLPPSDLLHKAKKFRVSERCGQRIVRGNPDRDHINRVTPSMEAGVIDRLFTNDELVGILDEWDASQKAEDSA